VQKWIGFVLVSVAVIILIGCGKERNNGNAGNAAATAGATTDNEKKEVVPGLLSEFVGTYTKTGNPSKFSGFDVYADLQISITGSQFLVTKTCIREKKRNDKGPDYEKTSEEVHASAQIEVIDRNHFKIAEGIARTSSLYIPTGDDVECGFKFPAGTYVLDYVGNELVIGGPSGLVVRFPKR